MTLPDHIANHFRHQLREAREQAVKDAESFDQILYAIERLGLQLSGELAGLGSYRSRLVELATESPLGAAIPKEWPHCHTPFERLFSLVKEGRNDAMHVGAAARHLTTHAIELALILEDSLTVRENEMLISDLMVRNPVCAELWAPISFVRHAMLSNSFSYLPVMVDSEGWKLVSDSSVAKFLRGVSNTKRKERLAMPLSEAIHCHGMALEPVVCLPSEVPVGAILDGLDSRPILVVRVNDPQGLVGIVSSFDLL